jgi:outer membrane protein assembly factor BamD (BamD/ComL family)
MNRNYEDLTKEEKALKVLKEAVYELEGLKESYKEARRLLDEAYAKMPHENSCSKGKRK